MTGIVLIALVVVAIAIPIWGRVARARIEARAVQERCLNEFFDSAIKLIDDDRVPDEVAFGLVRLSRRVYSPKLARSLFWHLLRRKEPEPLDANATKLIKSMPTEQLRDVFLHTIVAFAFAMTYNTWLSGLLLRRLFWVRAPKRKAKVDDVKIAAVMKELDCRNGNALAA